MEAYVLILVASVILLCAFPALLLASNLENAKAKPAPPAPHKRSEVETPKVRRKKALQGLQLEPWRQLRNHYASIDEIARLFRQSGISSAADQMRFSIMALAATVLVTLSALAMLLADSNPLPESLLYSAFIAIACLLLLKKLLKGKAENRQKALDDEALMLIQTTRMLWRVGLSLPKTLSILCDELRHLTPATSDELKIAVKRIDTGQSQDEALQELANNTTAEGFREYLIVLKQESNSGGGIDRSLQELYEVLQSRRKTTLQEKVSKTSGSMSIVMMLFMFPALLIVVGGPGFLAIAKALSNLNGG